MHRFAYRFIVLFVLIVLIGVLYAIIPAGSVVIRHAVSYVQLGFMAVLSLAVIRNLLADY